MLRVFFLLSLLGLQNAGANDTQIRVLVESSKQVHIVAERIRILNTDSLEPFPVLESPAVITLDSDYKWPLQLLLENGFVNGKPSSDFVTISKAESDLQVIVRLPIERYLLGVLAKEVPARWPLEALKAQAIASRSYAYSSLNESLDVGEYDVRSDVFDQVFEFQKSDLNDDRLQSIRDAVRVTAGTVLINNSKVVKAYFHADCGGVTVNAESVWGSEPQRVVSTDRLCNVQPEIWEFKASQNKFPDLAKNIKLSRHSKIEKLSANEVRKVFGFELLKSAWFSVTKNGKDLIFKGKGRGHGVGLCQMGSMKWAKAGWDSAQIIKHYYPDFKISKISQIKK